MLLLSCPLRKGCTLKTNGTLNLAGKEIDYENQAAHDTDGLIYGGAQTQRAATGTWWVHRRQTGIQQHDTHLHSQANSHIDPLTQHQEAHPVLEGSS
jgi:hypothetical protein